MGKLSVTGVKAAKRPGRFGDGDGLFLVVGATGSKSWVCRVQKHGRRRDIGLGSASKVTLAVARGRAREVRTWVELGLDPVFEKRKAGGIPTFREATAKVYAANRKTWRNEKHEGQWLRTLEAFAYPIIGDIRVSLAACGRIPAVCLRLSLQRGRAEPSCSSKTTCTQCLYGRLNGLRALAARARAGYQKRKRTPPLNVRPKLS